MRKLVAAALLTVAVTGCARKSAPMLAFNDSAFSLRDVLESGVEAGGGGGAASLGEPTGWATLTGTFTIDGPAPPRAPLNVTKDQGVCAPNGQVPLREAVVIDSSNGGIKDVLVFISSKLPQDDPNWEHESYQADKFGEVIFDQKACVFLTHVAAMRSTQKLRVLNSDTVGHNTNLDSKRGARSANFMVASGSQDSIYEPGAASPNPFGVSCSIHPWMKANMMVCDHPYFAVTKSDGSFEIPNVPAGVELEFRVWQEGVKGGYLKDVIVNGEAQSWSKGKFKQALSTDQRLELNVQVPSTAFR